MRGQVLRALGCALAAAAATLAFAGQAVAAGNVAISQVYGGGGNTGAPYKNDFVELHNRSTSAISITGWSIQYASATGTGTFSSNVTPLSGVLAAGQYFLVQESGGTIGASLPTPDASGTIAMAATAGKVALVNTTTGHACNGASTPCSAGQLAQIVGLVGYGTGVSGASFFEGSGPAPALSNTTSDSRNDGGCTDTDNNATDFSAGAP